MNIPPRHIDLNLAEYYNDFVLVTGKARLKLIERDHVELHRKGISHTHLIDKQD